MEVLERDKRSWKVMEGHGRSRKVKEGQGKTQEQEQDILQKLHSDLMILMR